MARNNKVITVSAPGKIHFLGEHVVVFGKPALLAAIDKRCTVSLVTRKDKKIEIVSKNFNKSVTVSAVAVLEGKKLAQKNWETFIQNGDIKLLTALTKDPLSYPLIAVGESIALHSSRLSTGFTLTIDSQIPIGAGLGSSAAIAVTIAGAVSLFLQKNSHHPSVIPAILRQAQDGESSRTKAGIQILDPFDFAQGKQVEDDKLDLQTIYEIAFRTEQKKHGRPSGGDPAAVLHGGLLWFRKESNDLKIMQPISFTIPESISRNFYLVDSGRPEESTGEMVAFVKVFHDTHTEQSHRIFDLQEKLTRQLLSAIKNADEQKIMDTIAVGERNLEKLGVVSESAKKLIRAIEKTGGVAKISGGGGVKKGTGMLLVYHTDRKILEAMLQFHHLPFFQTQLGVEGLRIET